MFLGIAALVAVGTQSAYPPYAIAPVSGSYPSLPPLDSHLCVDQFGYRPHDVKFAVLSDPVRGFNSFDRYQPASRMQLRNRSGRIVFQGKPILWKGGAIHEDSGDRGWWFDFSSVTSNGQFYVYDPATKRRSALFRISKDVYDGVLRASTRMFYFQRLGTPIASKFAQGPWTDSAAEVQDRHARFVNAKTSVEQERDLSGGWMDAGDTDKYPPFNGDVIHPLLYAYTANPKAFKDDFGIPESGNGLPDILDEIKYQLDWLVRMQFPDGSVPVKMGNIDYAGVHPISADHRTRYYGPKDSGAAIYTCANFAHAARVYRQFGPWKKFAKDLEARAELSWNWFVSHPRTYKTDTGEIKSGIANRSDDEQNRMEAYAAIHLFALTGNKKYHLAIVKNIGASRQLSDQVWSPYEAGASEALVDYLTMPHADPVVVDRIRKQLTQSARNEHFAPPVTSDLYRAWMEPSNYHWGSNIVRSSWGVVALLAATQGSLDNGTRERLRQRAEDMLHSFHGVNPFSVVYLTNMGKYGAEHSLMALYHDHYGVGTPSEHNPPPGYVVGGPNQSYSGKAANGKPSVDWIRQQPRAKAYADFGLGWPESSWELSEPAIYYQAMYVRLAAAFAK